MEDREGRETSEDGRGKGGKTVVIEIWRKMQMKESEMEKEETRELRERIDHQIHQMEGR